MATTEKTIEIPAAVLKAENITFDDTKAKIGADKTQEAIETVANIAKGRNQAHVFNTTADMRAWLSNAANKGLWSKGDNIYIVELDVPDWWVAEVLTTADPDTGYYYEIAQLETQKVDLTNYLEQSDVVDSLTSTATNAPLSANQGRLLSENLAKRNLITYTNVTQLGLTLDNTLDEIFNAMPSLSQLVTLISQGKNLGGSLPNTNTAELIVTKGNHERAIAVLTQYANGMRRINHCYDGAWKGWETLAISASNQQVRFKGINLSASDIAYIYTDDDNINFRYKNSTGDTSYVNIRSIHGLLESVGSTLHSEKPVNETIVADGAEIVSLTIPQGGKWIITAYAGGRKILLKTDGNEIYKYGINPMVYMLTSGGVVRMINKSGDSITVYADVAQYYITAIRIG